MTRATRRRARIGTVAGVASLAALLAAGPAFSGTIAPDDTQIVTVTSASDNVADAGSQWIEQAYDCNDPDPNAPYLTPDQSFVNGPGDPVLGQGSHEMRTSQFSGDTQLFRTAQFDGTYAPDIKHLVYSSYAEATSGDATKQHPELRLSFDTDGDGATDTSLYYEPSINHPDDIQNGV